MLLSCRVCARYGRSMVPFIMSQLPRPEYPRPQMVRDGFINLNGQWDFAFDFGRSGRDRKMFENGVFPEKILVPFCPESKLSGIEHRDFIPAVWYRRSFTVPDDWRGGRTVLHFGAVDYYCEVYINSKRAGSHSGGYTSFAFDITEFLQNGENTLTVYAEDDLRSGRQPRGKQCGSYHSHGCDYTRTTGIWQTVWLERVPERHISSFKIYPNPDTCSVDVEVNITFCENAELRLSSAFEGRDTGSVSATVTGHTSFLHLPLSEKHLWEAGRGRLYDLKLTLTAGGGTDTVDSYFGLRSVSWDNNAMYLNGEKVFQRLVLDQGFYPDGVYTAPADEDLKKDIELSMALGFNGARLHEKLFEPRFHYWADRLGYLTWGEYGNWGLNICSGEGLRNFLPEWLEAVGRDFNHPSIIGWCPFNETWDNDGRRQDDAVLSTVYYATKAADATRPVIDTSGNFHVVTDIFDVHDYEQDVAKFTEKYEAVKDGGAHYCTFPDRQKYEGQPYFVSEYGGAWWSNRSEGGWGYGNAPKSPAEFADRYAGLTSYMLNHPDICAFCYTQLYDVEQEQNGLYTYARERKLPDEVYEKIREVNTQKAAIEKQHPSSGIAVSGD